MGSDPEILARMPSRTRGSLPGMPLGYSVSGSVSILAYSFPVLLVLTLAEVIRNQDPNSPKVTQRSVLNVFRRPRKALCGLHKDVKCKH